MKAHERHRLKEDPIVRHTTRVLGSLTEHRDRWIKGGVLAAAAIVLVSAVVLWLQHERDAGGGPLGVAMAIEQAPIAPAPTLPGATQTSGTYPTEQARSEAALKAFEAIASTYGTSPVGLTARYHVALAQMNLGRLTEAQQTFEQLSASAGSSIYGPMARMGRAEALAEQSKYDDAIKAFTDLSGERDSVLPVDGVLMQLAKTCAKAGKKQEAKAAYKRVVEEFPDSPFLQEATQQMALLG